MNSGADQVIDLLAVRSVEVKRQSLGFLVRQLDLDSCGDRDRGLALKIFRACAHNRDGAILARNYVVDLEIAVLVCPRAPDQRRVRQVNRLREQFHQRVGDGIPVFGLVSDDSINLGGAATLLLSYGSAAGREGNV